jgi:hypothetical protein
LRIQFVTWRLDRANHNRISPQAFDLSLGFQANAFADSQQPNYAGDSDEYTEHGQQGAEGVQPQTFDTQIERS